MNIFQRWSSKYPHCSSVPLPLFPLTWNDSQAWKDKHWSKDQRVIYCCRMGQDVVLAQQTVTAFRGEYCQGSPRRCLLTKLGKMQGFHQMQMTMNNMYDSMYPLCFQCGVRGWYSWPFKVMLFKPHCYDYQSVHFRMQYLDSLPLIFSCITWRLFLPLYKESASRQPLECHTFISSMSNQGTKFAISSPRLDAHLWNTSSRVWNWLK